MLSRLSPKIVAPLIVLVGLASGILFYQNNFNNHLDIVSAEADAVLAMSSSYVSQYSRLRSHTGQNEMPVPAEFRARAAAAFNQSYSSDEHFIALMVGMPDRYIETPPIDDEMSQLLESMKSGSEKRYSQLIDWEGKAVLRTMFPSVALEESCVNCHNKVQNTDEQWAIGDLMGAYVIDRGVERTRNRYAMYAALTGFLVTVILASGYVVGIQHQNLRRQAKLLGQLADSDPLTNCLNRRGLKTRTAAFGQGNDERHALLALDIDHFKQINDTHGHDVGDLVLVWFANTIRSELRANDILARVGGEEFIVCIMGVPLDRARTIADRICQRVASAPFVFEDTKIPVTVSIGAVHSSEKPERTFKRCSQIADKYLYKAKQSGRNQVVWSTQT